MKEKIAAIVVTFNRKKLLMKCVNAIFKQSMKPNAIFIIDGPSTDGTPEFLLKNGIIKKLPPKNPPKSRKWKTINTKNRIKIYYMRLYNDVGGAGGFNEGLKWACKEGSYDWFWLMDDDAEPTRDALLELLKAINRFQRKYGKKYKLGFLSSKVVWRDGSIHLMNIPTPSGQSMFKNKPPFNMFDDIDVILIYASSFVSTLIDSKAIAAVGLPIKEFFIWYDDVEYTTRIFNEGFMGLYVRSSITYHNTKRNYKTDVTTLEKAKIKRYFFDVRNRLYSYKKDSLLKFLLAIIYQLTVINWKILTKRKEGRMRLMIQNTKGVLSSILFNPKIEKSKC